MSEVGKLQKNRLGKELAIRQAFDGKILEKPALRRSAVSDRDTCGFLLNSSGTFRRHLPAALIVPQILMSVIA
jgi:hypothetical protein